MPRATALSLVSGLVLAAAMAADASPPVARGRAAFAAEWQAQGMQPVAGSRLDLLYAFATGPTRGAGPLRIAPVQVHMREDWQDADRTLERVRLRPEEVQQLKDEVAGIVGEELEQAFQDSGAWDGGTPVLQARVVDLYLNAPDLQAAARSHRYTRSFGDMVLVAELRDDERGRLRLASWDHRPAREYASPRLTTRVENAIEIRAAARGWARLLRREFEALRPQGRR